MQLYHLLSRFRFLNRYSYKFLFIAFLGIHIPLLGLIFFIVLSPEPKFSAGAIIVFALLFTLLATGVTLFILHQLIKPLSVAQQALTEYLNKRKLPALPTHFSDEVGVLLHDIQHTVTDLNALLEEKKDLVSMLSHDLRSPVITMLDAIRLLKEETDPETMVLYLEEMEKMGNKQLELMHSVLQLLKHESGAFSPTDLKPVKLPAFVKEVISQFEIPLMQKRLTLDLNLQDVKVMAEPAVFSQVLSNVLYNAIKFSEKGDRITVQSKTVNNKSIIQVRDNGIGFEPDLAEALFQKFTPHRKKGTSGEATNGIGLYLCRKMMQKQEGRIFAESEGLNLGTTITLELPNAMVASRKTAEKLVLKEVA